MKCVLTSVVTVLVLAAGAFFLGYRPVKTHDVAAFPVDAKQMADDLDGRSVPVAYGQYWPFDPTQGLDVTVVSKKRSDDFVVVVASLKASAKLPETKDKDAKLPATVKLGGLVKLTYEQVAGAWYLVGAENLTLRAVPAE